MRPTFDHIPPRQMHIWGNMMPKRGFLDYPAGISTWALGLLTSDDDHMFVLMSCVYVRMDWR